jgi:predicted site-specific integrase-resolvase
MRTATLRKPRYTKKETQALLGISESTLKRRIAAGEIATVRDVGLVFITAEEILRYANQDRTVNR